ncbi:hypothetical protein EX30DRAFT_373574 [Ascodesmis nigricans]|uniref:Uncharacterized protein n=1 Tax=Ascodesmis nigricans TaxID=341454 RepID=A0A4S2MNI3_9PEZI|nr:hypothetical protein EX30DRAFT_373574 [Ascodesmis nigricans]
MLTGLYQSIEADDAEGFSDYESGSPVSSTQSLSSSIKEHVGFQTDDLEKDWIYKKNHFNFIHSRSVRWAIKDWGKYIQQMFDNAPPGAYVEFTGMYRS